MEETQTAIRVLLDDREVEAFDVVKLYLSVKAPAGMRVSTSDVIRFSLHSAANLAAAEMASTSPEGDVNAEQ